MTPYVGYYRPENIVWSANIPVASSTWPDTRAVIERCFNGISTDTREQILWKNAASLYKL